MLVFSKEKYIEDVKKYNVPVYKFMLDLDGELVEDGWCHGYLVSNDWCEERKDETMKEMLERWRATKDADLLKACEIIEEQLDTADKYMDLLEEHESLQEEFEDYKKNVDENYEQKPFDPYEEYGINESDFH